MIIKLSEKDGKKGMFLFENKNNIKNSPNGKSMSVLLTEKANIILVNGDKEVTITGKELIEKLF